MDFKGFVEKAKDAAAAAAASATEQAKGFVGAATAQNVAASPTAPADGAEVSAPAEGAPTAAPKSFAALTSEKFSELKDLGTEKLQALINSFQQALPAILMAGYELTEFEVELGITPKLIPHFRHAAKSPEDVERARELVRDNKLGTLILGGLLKAGEVHKQINVAGFGFSHIEIELGLIPSVRLQYKNEGADGPPRAALPGPDTRLAIAQAAADPSAKA